MALGVTVGVGDDAEAGSSAGLVEDAADDGGAGDEDDRGLDESAARDTVGSSAAAKELQILWPTAMMSTLVSEAWGSSFLSAQLVTAATAWLKSPSSSQRLGSLPTYWTTSPTLLQLA